LFTNTNQKNRQMFEYLKQEIWSNEQHNKIT
jgi:hypothetical protein